MRIGLLVFMQHICHCCQTIATAILVWQIQDYSVLDYSIFDYLVEYCLQILKCAVLINLVWVAWV